MLNDKLMMEKEKLITFIFLSSYTTFYVFAMFGHIAFLGTYLKYLTYLGIFLLLDLFILRLNEYSSKEGLFLSFLILYSLFIAYKTNDYGYFKLSLMITVSKGISFNSCIKYDVLLRVISILIMLILYYIGMAPDYTSFVGSSVRHSMGFRNPNHFGLVIFILTLECLYLVRFKINAKVLLSIVLLTIFEYRNSGSRTAEIFILIALMISIIYSITPDLFNNKFSEFIMKYLALISAVITYIAYFLFSSDFALMKHLDTVFSGRITNISYYSSLFDLSLFGRNIAIANRTLDSLYAYLYFSSGVIVFVTVMFAYIKLIKDLYNYSNIPMAIIMSLLFLYGLSEKLWFQPDYNLLMLSFRQLIYHDVFLDDETICIEQGLIDY